MTSSVSQFVLVDFVVARYFLLGFFHCKVSFCHTLPRIAAHLRSTIVFT